MISMRQTILSIRLIFLMFGVFMILIQALYFYGFRVLYVEQKAVEEIKNFATENSKYLPQIIGSFISTGSLTSIESVFSQSMTKSFLEKIYMVDDQNSVRFSSNYQDKGKPISKTNPEFVSLISLSRDHFSLQLETSSVQNSLYATFPVVLKFNPKTLRPEKVGVIGMKMDLAISKQNARNAALLDFYRIIGVIAGLTFLVWLFLDRILNARISPLVQASRQMEKGEYSARTGLKGMDDLGRIGEAFDKMADMVEIRSESLKNQKASLSMAQQISHVGSWDWDILSGSLAWSDEVYRIFGLEPQEFPASYESFLNFIHPDDREDLQAAVTSAVEGKSPYDIHHRVVRKDGSIRFVHEKGEVFRDAEGNPISMVGAVHDLTEWNANEEKLRKNEARLLRAESLAKIGHWEADFEGRELLTSDGVKDIWGLSRDTIFTFDEFVARIHQEDVESVMASFAEAGEKMETFDREFRIIRPDGGQRYVRSMGEITLPENELDPPLFFGTLLDITELRAFTTILEERVQERTTLLSEALVLNEQVFSASVIGIAAYDSTGQCVLANEAAGKMVGATREQLLSQNYHTVGSWQKHGLTQMADESVASGVMHYGEFHIQTTFGKDVWLDCSFTPFQREGENHLLLMIHNITDRKLAEAQVMNMQEQMKIQQKMATIGNLTATVSHELRNPLATLKATVYNLKNFLGNKDEKVHRGLDRMERNVTRCDKIINDLLDFSRNTEPHRESTPFDVWLGELLAEEKFSDAVELKFNGNTEQLFITIDQDRIRRVIINLVENAVQAISDLPEKQPDAPSRITVSTKSQNERLEVCIKDTGPGMTEGVVAKIFEPLFSTKIYGVGLGLPTVRQILKQEGGGIEILSEVGTGTTALIWLPLMNHDQKVST